MMKDPSLRPFLTTVNNEDEYVISVNTCTQPNALEELECSIIFLHFAMIHTSSTDFNDITNDIIQYAI